MCRLSILSYNLCFSILIISTLNILAVRCCNSFSCFYAIFVIIINCCITVFYGFYKTRGSGITIINIFILFNAAVFFLAHLTYRLFFCIILNCGNASMLTAGNYFLCFLIIFISSCYGFIPFCNTFFCFNVVLISSS